MIFVIEFNVLSDCVWEICGMEFIVIIVILCLVSFFINSGFCVGYIKLISVVLGFSKVILFFLGVLILRIIFDC